jgi:hypothetical protein
LGIINLKNHNSALLLKYLHKFYNKLDLPWVQITWSKLYCNGTPPHERKYVGSFWWRDIMSLASLFLQMARCKVNNGLSVSFWTDHWNLGIIKDLYPQLFSFARKKKCSVNQFLSWDASRSFFLSLSQVAFEQFNDLHAAISDLILSQLSADEWTFVWSGGVFSSGTYYVFLQGSHPASPLLFKWLWSSRSQNKHMFFFWLFLRDKINTRNLLHRKQMFLPSYTCVLCVEMLRRISGICSSHVHSVMLVGLSWVFIGISLWISSR